MSFYSIAPFIQAHYPEYWGTQSYPAMQCVCIRKVKEEWGILGNFAPVPIIIDGVTFDTCERLFQCMKFKDREAVDAVFHANNPKMTAKHWEKDYRRADWGQMIVDAMKFCLGEKYEQSEAFRNELERSKGLFIVEDQTSFPKKEPDAWGVKPQGDNFVGPNLLGRFLMELRDKGTLTYRLPDDGLAFIEVLKANE